MPPKRYNQVRDRIVMNNLDSNQRHREPPEEEKYPKKNLQTNFRTHNAGLQRQNNVLLDSISNQESQGGLAKKLNHQHEIIQQKHQLGSNVPQILFPSEAGAAGQVYQGTFKQLGINTYNVAHIKY